jgi:hypothetical protein
LLVHHSRSLASNAMSLMQLLLTYLTYFMEQIPSWEANQFSSQEIPCILWNLKVHYHVYRNPPPIPILSHYYSPIYVWVLQVVSFPQVFLPKPCKMQRLCLKSSSTVPRNL